MMRQRAGAGRSQKNKSTGRGEVTRGLNLDAFRVLLLRMTGAALLLVLGLLLPVPPLLETLLCLCAFVGAGYDVFLRVAQNLRGGRIFDESLLISLATVGALCIGAVPEAAGVMIFYQAGVLMRELVVGRSHEHVESSLDRLPAKALVAAGNGTREVPVEEVRVGGQVLVPPGARIPLDGVVFRGNSTVDASALTGEAAPRDVGPGDTVLAGTRNGDGALAFQVTAQAQDTVAARAARLAREAPEKKAKLENFIQSFTKIYTPVVFVLALVIALLPPLLVPGATFSEYVYRALVFLVIACPCALVVSVPLSYFAGIGSASRRGIHFRGSDSLEQLALARTALFGKTGTLTTGEYRLDRVFPAQGVTEHQLLGLAAMAEARSDHPVARAVVLASGPVPLAEDYRELPGMGVCCKSRGLVLCAGNLKLMEKLGVEVESPGEGTAVYVAAGGRYMGALTLRDPLRPEAAETLDALRKLGFTHLGVLTGDTRQAAQTALQGLGLDEIQADLLPDAKMSALEACMEACQGPVAFVSGGGNDGPVLVRSDVGVTASPLGRGPAVQAADAVLLSEDLKKLPQAVAATRKTHRIVMENAVFTLAFKVLALVLGAMGMIPMWFAAVADVGVTLLCMVNAIR